MMGLMLIHIKIVQKQPTIDIKTIQSPTIDIAKQQRNVVNIVIGVPETYYTLMHLLKTF